MMKATVRFNLSHVDFPKRDLFGVYLADLLHELIHTGMGPINYSVFDSYYEQITEDFGTEEGDALALEFNELGLKLVDEIRSGVYGSEVVEMLTALDGGLEGDVSVLKEDYPHYIYLLEIDDASLNQA